MDTISTFLLICITFWSCLLGALYIHFTSVYNYWKTRGVPHVKPSIPTGNIREMIQGRKSIGEIYKDLYTQLEGERFGGFYQFNKPSLLIRDPDLIKKILVKDFEHFHDHGFSFDENVDPMIANLFFLNGLKWKNLRSKLSPTFTSGKMRMMFHILVACGHELEDYLEEPANRGDVIEVKDLLARFATDVIALCAFGIRCDCIADPYAEFRQNLMKLFDNSFKQALVMLLYFVLPSIPISLNIPQVPKDVGAFARRVVQETIDYREKNNIKRNDFMQLLIRLKNEGTIDDDEVFESENGSDKPLSLDEVTAQALVFFAAGFDTSSTNVSFCLYELALNPDIQERVQREVEDVLDENDGNIMYESLQEMTYLDKVIMETLRKYPPGQDLSRVCTKEYKIPGTEVVVEEGMKVVVSVIGLHHDPKYYPDPDKFDPERFSEAEKNRRHHYAFLPFGEGPRICIGMRFALMMTKMALIFLLSNYEFQVCEKTQIPVVYDPQALSLASAGGTWLRIKNRAGRS